MEADRDRSPAAASYSSSSSAAATVRKDFRRRRSAEEEDGEDPVACTWKSCQSCTAGAIADCVAICCCPCGVVSILVLAFIKLPWAVARRCIGRRRLRRRRTMLEGKDMDGILGRERVQGGKSETVVSRREGEELNYHFSPDIKTEDDVWIELFEFGNRGFGRLSLSGRAIEGFRFAS